MELSCWIALPFARKVILAGDHHQLPPTILSESASKKGLSFTLMERAIKELGEKVVRMLTTQYRMHASIMRWSSSAFYDSKLEAHPSVKSHLLSDLPGVAANEDTRTPLLLVDTTGCDMFELQTRDEISRANEGEVAIVCLHVKRLIRSGVRQEDIAIITPYNLQVKGIPSFRQFQALHAHFAPG